MMPFDVTFLQRDIPVFPQLYPQEICLVDTAKKLGICDFFFWGILDGFHLGENISLPSLSEGTKVINLENLMQY